MRKAAVAKQVLMTALLLVNVLVVAVPCLCPTHPAVPTGHAGHACCQKAATGSAAIRGGCCCDGDQGQTEARAFTPPPPALTLGLGVVAVATVPPAAAATPVARIGLSEFRPPTPSSLARACRSALPPPARAPL